MVVTLIADQNDILDKNILKLISPISFPFLLWLLEIFKLYMWLTLYCYWTVCPRAYLRLPKIIIYNRKNVMCTLAQQLV